MMQNRVQGVYRMVIDEVIAGVRHDFLEASIDEAVLDELRVSWEAKLSQSGALDHTAYNRALEAAASRPVAQGSTYTPHSSHGAAGSSAYSAYRSTPQPGPYGSYRSAAQQSPYGAAAGPSTQPALQLSAEDLVPASSGPASFFPSPGQFSTQRTPVYLPPPLSGSRGAQLQITRSLPQPDTGQLSALPMPGRPSTFNIPQRDGPGDETPGKQKGAPRKKAKLAAGATAASGPAGSSSSSSSESEAGDNLSDVELDDEEDVFCDKAPEQEHPHKVLCLFDVVKRQKVRWKCQLSNLVVNIHGVDMLFSDASADLLFQY